MIDGVKCGPDGVRCDVDGNVWVLQQRRPRGRLQRRHRLDSARQADRPNPSAGGLRQLAFGGPKRNRLFMAASQSLYALYVNTQGAGPA